MATEYMAQSQARVTRVKTPPYSTFRHSDDEPITPENTNEPYGESGFPSNQGFTSIRKHMIRLLHKEYTNKGFWANIRLIRCIDVLLMGAESANEKGIPGEVIDYLEQVRIVPEVPIPILPKVTTTDQGELRDAIRHERRGTGNGIRPFLRSCSLGVLQRKYCTAGKTNYQDKNALLPLPQTEIDKSKRSTGTEPRLSIKSFSVPNSLASRCRNYCFSNVRTNVLLGADIQHIGRTFIVTI